MKKSFIKKIIRHPLCLLLGLGCMSFFIILAAEFIHIFWLESFGQAFAGIQEILLKAWVTSSLTTFLFILLFWAIFNRVSIAILSTGTLVGILLFAHVLKIKSVGKSLAMSDFSLIGDVFSVGAGILSAYLLSFIFLGIFLVFSLIGFVFLICRPPKSPLTLRGRLALVLLIMAIFFSGFLETPKHEIHGFLKNESKNGFFCNFLRSQKKSFQKPDGYSQNTIATILQGEELGHTKTQGGYPDIVIYLGESFMNLNRLYNIKFNQDPTPNFNNLQRYFPKGRSGRLTSPETGGVTANVEFEVLTGIPTSCLPQNTVAYHHSVQRETPAMPWIFRKKGYRAAAFHNFYGTTFQIKKKYPFLGFQEFKDVSEIKPIGFDGPIKGTRRNGKERGLIDFFFQTLAPSVLDEMIGDHSIQKHIDGLFPSDEPLILSVLEALDSSPEPAFLFAVGMVSHGSYGGWPEDQKTIRIENEDLSAFDKDALEHLANALNKVDHALGYLLSAVEKRERPTVVFFFGDHLPFISDKTLKAGGFDFGNDAKNRYEVPFIIYTNDAFDAVSNLSLKELNISDRMSMFYMPTILLRIAGIHDDRYFNFLESQKQIFTALNSQLLITPDGSTYKGADDPVVPIDTSQKIRIAVDELTLLAFDRLSGEEFSK